MNFNRIYLSGCAVFVLLVGCTSSTKDLTDGSTHTMRTGGTAPTAMDGGLGGAGGRAPGSDASPDSSATADVSTSPWTDANNTVADGALYSGSDVNTSPRVDASDATSEHQPDVPLGGAGGAPGGRDARESREIAGSGGTGSGGASIGGEGGNGGTNTGGIQSVGGAIPPDGAAGTGGIAATSGTNATGGSGGASATGGIIGTGGLAATGGTNATGGIGTGGVTSIGGTAFGFGGSTISTGGMIGTGGVTSTGGTVSSVDAGATVLSAGATDGRFPGADLGVDITGTGTAPIGTISIADGHGTVSINGQESVAAFIAARQELYTYALYEMVAVAPDRLSVVWVYCKSGLLTNEYWEDSRGMASTASARGGADRASGTCVEHLEPAEVSVALPAFSVSAPPPVTDVAITATDLTYDGHSAGTLVDNGITYTLYPFHHIDCSTCGSTGWQEIHSLFVQPGSIGVSFGIIYLFPAAANRLIQLSYSVTLPSLTSPPDRTFDGTWVGSGGAVAHASSGASVPIPMPHMLPPPL